MDYYARQIALNGLEIQAIKLSPGRPFIWASGYQMPIYNDNRMFLAFPDSRKLIAEGFENVIRENALFYDFIAGTSTAGISPATTLADRNGAPLCYVRDKPKDHGLKNQIEGLDATKDFEGKRVILIEDLISTGGSSVAAVQAIRNANGKIDACLSIFNYDLEPAVKEFEKIDCKVFSLLHYDQLLEIAIEKNYISEEQRRILEEWRADPFGWGEKHGFPKVEKDKK